MMFIFFDSVNEQVNMECPYFRYMEFCCLKNFNKMNMDSFQFYFIA